MAWRQWRQQKALQKENLPQLFKLAAFAPEASRHLNDVVALLYHDDRLISGADDGKIKVWTPQMEMVSEVAAHPVNVLNMAILDNTLYSCSNDGTVKAWCMDTWQCKSTIHQDLQNDVIKLCVDSGRVYACNDRGDVFVFENDVKVATYSLEENVADFIVLGSLVFNARNTDITVTEMRPGPNFGYMSKGAMIGRFPIRYIGDKICFLSRSARNIYVHCSTMAERFKRIAEIRAHDMTITSMCGLKDKENIMLSGGYDRIIRGWDLNTFKKLSQIDVNMCINELCSGAPGQFYFSSTEGYIGRIDATI